MSNGFELKTSTLIPAEIASRTGSQQNPDSLIFFLQKGPQLATCYNVFSSVTSGQYLDALCNVAQ
jgi:hypothetical protein